MDWIISSIIANADMYLALIELEPWGTVFMLRRPIG